jgi:FAD/FMN-containing dehydrogenase
MKRPTGKGVTLERGAPGFDDAVLSSSFNGRDPGVRPHVVVQANNAQDVVGAINRARREGLKLSLCSGGHSWAQNHIRDGGLLLDMARLNHIEIDAASMTARVGPGCWSLDLDNALKAKALFFPVAHAPDVCMGGFLLQGGFGWNSRALGLACESVIGLDVVLADGQLVHASATENPDLYWAARGSGPGFFGAVVNYHLRLHPRPKACGIVIQVFRLKHLEAVFRWAEQAAPDVSRAVEFQMLITPKVLGLGVPGIEVVSPVMADSWAEAKKAVRFVTHSPVKTLASIAMPLLPLSTAMMSNSAARSHFPPRMRWCVDNMWTNAPMDDLLPGLKRIGETMPTAPSHALWMNWRPPEEPRPDMAFSVEANAYLAAYGEWRDPADDARFNSWATDRMAEMAHLSQGIQLADENLALRPARFINDEKMARLDQIRSHYDPHGMFNAWTGRVN